MRDDQPVVSAASWMVSASTRPNLIKLVSRFGRGEDALAVLGALLVEPHHRADRVVGVAQALDDLARLHRAVAVPRRLDVDFRGGRGGALALDRALGLALFLAQPGGLRARRALGGLAGLAAGLTQPRGAVGVRRLGLRGHVTAVVPARGLGLRLGLGL